MAKIYTIKYQDLYGDLSIRSFDELRTFGATPEWFELRCRPFLPGVRRGDVVRLGVLPAYTQNYVYDGKTLELITTLCQMPNEFLVPTEFPVDHWIEKSSYPVPLDVAAHRQELISNLAYDVPPEITILEKVLPADGSGGF